VAGGLRGWNLGWVGAPVHCEETFEQFDCHSFGGGGIGGIGGREPMLRVRWGTLLLGEDEMLGMHYDVLGGSNAPQRAPRTAVCQGLTLLSMVVAQRGARRKPGAALYTWKRLPRNFVDWKRALPGDDPQQPHERVPAAPRRW